MTTKDTTQTAGTCSTCQQRLPGTAAVGRPLAPGLCCLLWHGLPQGLIRPSVVHALQLRPGGTAGAYKAGFEGATQDCPLGTGGPMPSCPAQAVRLSPFSPPYSELGPSVASSGVCEALRWEAEMAAQGGGGCSKVDGAGGQHEGCTCVRGGQGIMFPTRKLEYRVYPPWCPVARLACLGEPWRSRAL